MFVGETFEPILFTYHAAINFAFLTWKLEKREKETGQGSLHFAFTYAIILITVSS